MNENDYPGTFIVIEGPDASGKQTQADRIVKWLRDSEHSRITEAEEQRIIEKMPGDYPNPEEEDKVDDSIRKGVWQLSFPTYGQTAGGRVVEAYLNGRLGDRKELSVEEIVDIFAADRKQFRMLIEEYLENGGIIVCDRYREANLIHQLVGFEGEEWAAKLNDIKSVDSDMPDADQIFYLNISPEEAASRMAEKKKDIHESDRGYMQKSNQNGRKVAETEGWKMIEGERSRDEVEKDLRVEIKKLFTQ